MSKPIIRLVTPLLLSISPLAQAILCTITSDQYPGFNDGVLFSKEITLTGGQGTPAGHQLLLKHEQAEFWLVAGSLIKIGGGKPILQNFYTEVRLLEAGGQPTQTLRAMSGIHDGIAQARLELVHYPPQSWMYEGILVFSCSQYE